GNGSTAWPWAPCDERLCSALPLRALAPATAVCAALFVLGVAGNALTVLVVARGPRPPASLYLGSMAVSDLLILLGLPLDLYRLWRSRPWLFGQLLCRLSHFVAEGCAYCSVLHVTALTGERYLAVRFPLRARALASERRVKAVIGALWAVAFLSAVPFLFLVGVERAENGTDASRECKPTPQALRSGLLAAVFWVSTGYFVLPVACLHVLYGCVRRRLRHHAAPLQGPDAVRRARAHRQALHILLAVVLAFVICWLPFHVGRIIFISTRDTRTMLFSQYFNLLALQLFYLSASINPILYNAVSKRYREAACRLLLPRGPARRAI
ncbi:MTLR protein, partial [Crypturellus undulatus]|nr:MTLR protein [Crypturellus undulatus]